MKYPFKIVWQTWLTGFINFEDGRWANKYIDFSVPLPKIEWSNKNSETEEDDSENDDWDAIPF